VVEDKAMSARKAVADPVPEGRCKVQGPVAGTAVVEAWADPVSPRWAIRGELVELLPVTQRYTVHEAAAAAARTWLRRAHRACSLLTVGLPIPNPLSDRVGRRPGYVEA
jgi:hypothetical protein